MTEAGPEKLQPTVRVEREAAADESAGVVTLCCCCEPVDKLQLPMYPGACRSSGLRIDLVFVY